MQMIGFGGGCHWCTEAVYQSLIGVEKVEQGFIRSDAPNDSYSEAVVVHFDEAKISKKVLMEIHLRTHASTSSHTMRGKYRSAIYVETPEQAQQCGAVLKSLQAEFDQPLVTQVLFNRGFKFSDDRFQNYYASDPERPFCKAYIDPKLKLLTERFAENFKRV